MVLSWRKSVAGIGLGTIAVLPGVTQAQNPMPFQLAPATMKRVGKVDERYQSYNVEMLEVTGGRFWKPYKDIPKPPARPPARPESKPRAATRPPG